MNFNSAYFTGLGMLSYGCINKSDKDFKKGSQLCMHGF